MSLWSVFVRMAYPRAAKEGAGQDVEIAGWMAFTWVEAANREMWAKWAKSCLLGGIESHRRRERGQVCSGKGSGWVMATKRVGGDLEGFLGLSWAFGRVWSFVSLFLAVFVLFLCEGGGFVQAGAKLGLHPWEGKGYDGR